MLVAEAEEDPTFSQLGKHMLIACSDTDMLARCHDAEDLTILSFAFERNLLIGYLP